MKDNGGIFEILEGLGLATQATREVYAGGTRDRDDLPVYRDKVSGVVYIDNFYVGDETYQEGVYRQQTSRLSKGRSLDVELDTRRRVSAYTHLAAGKTVTEFGCGDGAFVRAISDLAAHVTGVELQQDYIAALKADGIPCIDDISLLGDGSQDAVFSFHVLEHLPQPVRALEDQRRILKSGGVAVLEVPHAADFLLSRLKSEAFRKFTLWSQHLILHTRESLRRMLEAAGFEDVVIEGVQRKPVSNHLGWLANEGPGGHVGPLSVIDTPELNSAYEAALRKIDATDTLVAVARKA